MYKHINLTDEQINELLKVTINPCAEIALTDTRLESSWWWDEPKSDEPKQEEESPPPVPKCSHDWKRDSYFNSVHVYITCTKCGMKKEDE